MPTYKPLSLSEVFGRTTARFSRVHLEVEVGPSLDVLGLADPWFQFSVLEDGRGVTG